MQGVLVELAKPVDHGSFPWAAKIQGVALKAVYEVVAQSDQLIHPFPLSNNHVTALAAGNIYSAGSLTALKNVRKTVDVALNTNPTTDDIPLRYQQAFLEEERASLRYVDVFKSQREHYTAMQDATRARLRYQAALPPHFAAIVLDYAFHLNSWTPSRLAKIVGDNEHTAEEWVGLVGVYGYDHEVAVRMFKQAFDSAPALGVTVGQRADEDNATEEVMTGTEMRRLLGLWTPAQAKEARGYEHEAATDTHVPLSEDETWKEMRPHNYSDILHAFRYHRVYWHTPRSLAPPAGTAAVEAVVSGSIATGTGATVEHWSLPGWTSTSNSLAPSSPTTTTASYHVDLHTMDPLAGYCATAAAQDKDGAEAAHQANICQILDKIFEYRDQGVHGPAEVTFAPIWKDLSTTVAKYAGYNVANWPEVDEPMFITPSLQQKHFHPSDLAPPGYDYQWSGSMTRTCISPIGNAVVQD